MDLFGAQKVKERKSHFRNLVGVASADGTIDKNEKDLILRIGKRIGLTKNDINEVMRSGKISFTPPASLGKRFEQLYDLVIVMLADGKIYQREMNYCQKVAKALGFNPVVINQLINLIIEQSRKGVQKEKVKSEASEFLNGL